MIKIEVKEKHCIYLYTNKINNKQYVGQTNDFARRKREHNCDAFNENRSGHNDVISRAIRKYGKENFKIELLVDDLTQEEANFLEDFYINEYNTRVPNGYNVREGGKGASVTRLSKEEIAGIKNALKNGQTYSEIEEKFKIVQGYISMINHGKFFYDEKEQYPLMKKQLTKDDKEVQEVVYLLKNTNLTLQEIANKVHMCKASVVKINNGTYHHGASDHYPVRKTKEERNLEAAKLLKETNWSTEKISKEVGLSCSTILNINKGRYRRFEGYTYPIR